MLALSDPLWCKLNTAYGFAKDIPLGIVALAERWDEEAAGDLMHGELIHQETCYGATYAAAPYLLKLAQPDDNVVQRMDIAVFLGHLALCAFSRPEKGARTSDSLNGLALNLECWEQTRDPYRSKPAQGAGQQMSKNHRDIMDLEPPSDDELRKFEDIRDSFLAVLPDIGSLCERTFHEHSDDEYIPRYLLSGIAAVGKRTELAQLLDSGEDGSFRCAACGTSIDFILFGDLMALYFDNSDGGPAHTQEADRAMLDWQEGEAKRADGMVKAYDDLDEHKEPSLDKLISLARQAENPSLELLLRNFLGEFRCAQCDETCQVCAPYSGPAAP
ncbi:MAG: hypothetical protein AAF299_07705 [Pseudomonadota bacterium]